MADVVTRPEPDAPGGTEEPVELSEPAGPPNRPKPESQHNGPFPILEPAERA
jgi:hypothetical protein